MVQINIMKKIKEGMLAILVVIIIWSAMGFMFGLIDSASQRTQKGEDGCRYKSIASITNPGYVAMCELFRARFDLPKRK